MGKDLKYFRTGSTYALPAKFRLHILQPGTLALFALLILTTLLWHLAARASADSAVPYTPDQRGIALLVGFVGFVFLPTAGAVFAKLVTNASAPPTSHCDYRLRRSLSVSSPTRSAPLAAHCCPAAARLCRW